MEAQNKYNFKNITETIIYIILCHCLGDYFFQTEYLAINKGSDNYILFVHCVTYCNKIWSFLENLFYFYSSFFHRFI